MTKIYRYSLSHTKTSVSHISEIYEKKELCDLLFDISNEIEDINDGIFDEAIINQNY
jgi:hypothetical protein